MDLDWTLDLLSDTREIVGELLAEPVGDLAALAVEVATYRERIRLARASDLDLAEALARGTLALLHRVQDAGADAQQVASVAARYFLCEEDGESDLASLFGFDDDLEVFNAAAGHLAPDLVITR